MSPRPLLQAGPDRRRLELRDAVARMATAIARGELTPTPHELEALAQICADHFLPVEAARVRRWRAVVTPEALT